MTRSPEIMEVLSGMLVAAFGIFLIGLAVLSAIKPQLAERFLGSFASSARAHYTEQALRLIAGGALVSFAHAMWYPDLFKLFGWLIVVTATLVSCSFEVGGWISAVIFPGTRAHGSPGPQRKSHLVSMR
jgi:hypothetical protein